MNANPAGSSRPQQKLHRMFCGAARADPKAHLCSQSLCTLCYWTLICFTEEYLTAEYLTLGLVSAENVKENKTKNLKPKEKYRDRKPCPFIQNCGEVSATTVLEMDARG